MVDKERSPRTNIIILAVIGGIALVLSIFSYQYSIVTSNKIVDIASQEVRSNVRIEVHEFRMIGDGKAGLQSINQNNFDVSLVVITYMIKVTLSMAMANSTARVLNIFSELM